MNILFMILMLFCKAGFTGGVSENSTADSIRTGTIDVGGTMLYYETCGAGEPVLFIHAGIADCRMWDDQMQKLSKKFMLIRYDIRGFGKTPRGTIPFTHYHDIAVLLDSLGINKVRLVGASFGGSLAIDFALTYPQRVRSLILCAPAISGMTPSSEMAVIDSTEEAFLRIGDTVGAAEFNVRTWVAGPFRRLDDVQPALRQKVIEMQMHNYAVPSGARSIPLEPRAFARLEEIAMPTLILNGDEDVPFFQNLSAIAASRIPNAKRKIIPDAAHLINMEKPELFNNILVEFIAGS